MRKTLCMLLAAVMLLAIVPAVAETAQKERVTITFGGWGDIVLLHEQVEAFEKKYDWIDVDIVKPAGRDWYTGDLTQLAAEGKMPDVFNIESLFTSYSNGWCYDMTELFRNDPDSVNYPAWMLPYGVVDGHLIGLYGALYAYGVEVNLTLLEELNIPAPDYDWTIEEWADLLRQLNVPGTCIGAENLFPFFEYIVPQYDPTLNCFGYNSTTHNWIKSDALAKSLDLIYGLAKEGVSLEEYLRENIGWPGDGEETVAARNAYMMEALGASDNLWLRGLVGMRVNGSWAMNWAANNPELYAGFEWDFYPFPSAVEGELARTALLNEYLGISATCKNPEEAYLLVKYMTYDMDGYEAKVDFMVNFDRDAMIAKYPEIDSKFVPGKIKIWLLGCSSEPRADEIFAKMNVDGEMSGLAAAFANRNNNAFMLPDRFGMNWWDCYGTTEWFVNNDLIKLNKDAATVMDMIVNYCENSSQTAFANFGYTYGYGE